MVHSLDEEWLSKLNDNFELIRTDIDHYSWEEQKLLPKIIKNSNCDLLFSPHFNIPFFCGVPFVITIHDLILHRYPNQSPLLKRMAYKILISRAVKRATHIIAISNFVLNDISNTFGRRRVKKKTSVIYEGVSDLFTKRSFEESKQVLEKYNLKQPFFLYVGNAKQHKNVQKLIDAHNSLSENPPYLVLVCSGSESKKLRINNKTILLPDVPDEDLPALYSSALCFITASLYEGYCLPVIEAQACGCPVIASNKGAIPEVAGKGAVIIEPTVDMLSKAMSNPPMPPERFCKPRWEDTAEKTLDVLIKSTI